ncbi:hypothetical protein [Pseudomonas sp. CCC2.2]|uniref:hypothetical protein n=1 Tax=Pseudomonas sp. CCC2.2 TaxID=3048605 RepID=UPI002B23B781|nr:hypothetical protein [Pseudomonas sp. CCC2.2]MEB0149931.1 hypothetical protein [Pseudomonas sp. CCC2.2]
MKAIHKTICIAAAIGATLISGCASIVSESKPKVGIYSMPTGAKYDVLNSSGQVVASGVTPGGAILKSSRGYFKSESYSVAFRKEGHADTVTPLKSSVNGWYWGNIAFGGLIGMLIVDPLTGAMYTLPDDVTGSLPSLAKAQAPAPVQTKPIEQLSQQ